MRLRSVLGVLAGATALAGCDLFSRGSENKVQAEPEPKVIANAAGAGGIDDAAGRRLCASGATYQRLKTLAFEEARRARGIDAPPLDALSRATVVRMERPLVLSRDEGLGVTVCSGRIVFELPPGAARSFNGLQRLVSDIEYSAQEAADGSGPVFQMSGAEPITVRLAAFNTAPRASGTAVAQAPVGEPAASPDAEPRIAQAEPIAPPPPPRSRLTPTDIARDPGFRRDDAPEPVRAPRPAASQVARPSFNCRYAGTPSERAICADADLASRDRRMAAAYFAAYGRAAPSTRRELSRSRAEFLRRRERCDSDGCIADVYDDRIDEISRIAGE